MLLNRRLVERARLETVGGNARTTPPAALESALRTIVARMRALTADGTFDQLDVVAIGAAGAGSQEARDRVARCLRAAIERSDAFVTTDAAAALAGVTDDPAACGIVALIAGTGSIAVGRADGGAEVRVGGIGFPAGDEGGAAWIGRAAIADGIVPAPARAIDAGDARGFAAVFPAVLAAARANDPRAVELLGAAARHLASLAAQLVELTAARAVGIHGGVFAAADLVRAPFDAALRARAPGVRIAPLRHAPEVAVVRAALVARGQPLP